MTEQIELIHGSGNVYEDFEYADADIRQAKAILGAKIIGILDARGLSTRKAQAATGVNHSDFTRIRNAQFRRFTIDRLIIILNKLDQELEVNITVHPRGEYIQHPETSML